MAIARMLRVNVIGHTDVVDDVTVLLQRAGVLEMEKREIEHGGVTEMSVNEPALYSVERVLARAQFVRDFLKRFHHPDVAFGAFISEKIHLTTQEYRELTADAEFDALYRECDSISARLGDIDRERGRLETMICELRPWRDLHLQISQWQGTEHVSLFTGTVPLESSAEIRQALRDVVDEVTVAEVGHDTATEAWVVMAHASRVEDVRAALSITDFRDVGFPGLDDYPAEEIACAEDSVESLRKERAGLEERAGELAQHYGHVFALAEALQSDHDAVQARACYAATDRTFMITGWIPTAERERLLAVLAPVGSEIDASFEEPQDDDDVPVELVNSRFVRPFEILTDLYGRPSYRTFDPTPIVAPFFFLFFGMCLGDVAYGLMLMGGAWFIKTRLDVAPGVQKFMDLLVLGGVAAALWGVVTRSYFALPADKLPEFLQYEPLIDPQSELLLLLGFSIAVGVLHVSVGVGLAAFGQWRDGDTLGAIQDQLSILVFIAALLVSVLGMLGVLDDSVIIPALIFGFGELMLFKGHLLDPFTAREPFRKIVWVPFKGLLGVYGMVGFASDFLSYTRLAALGLASLYVGDAMNRLSALSVDIPYLGIIIAAAIFVVGHTFNVVINLLGAFVHPTRLQYVEFFGKFYQAGGRAFRPFEMRKERLVLRPRKAGGEEGG